MDKVKIQPHGDVIVYDAEGREIGRTEGYLSSTWHQDALRVLADAGRVTPGLAASQVSGCVTRAVLPDGTVVDRCDEGVPYRFVRACTLSVADQVQDERGVWVSPPVAEWPRFRVEHWT